MSKIFEEAIADVKKLKEVAEENAKKAIIESVTPKIRDYVEQQIFEKAGKDVEDEEVSEEDVELAKEELKELAALMNESGNTKNRHIESALSKFSNKNKQKIINIINKINENKDTFTSDKINKNRDTQRGNDMSEKFYEIDLKLLREAVNEEAEAHKMAEKMADAEDEASEGDYGHSDEMSLDEMDQLDMMYEQDEESEEDSEMEDMEAAGGASIARSDVEAAVQDLIAELDLEIGGAGAAPEEDSMELDLSALGGEDSEEEPSEEEPEQLDEIFDIDPDMLREELANIRSMLSEGKVDHHFGGKGSGKTNHSNAFGGPGPKKHGHQKAFGGGSEGKDVFVNPPSTLKKLNEAKKMLQKLSRENRAQNEKLNKYRGAVQTLREQLEDLNLFNAKLLYVNKLLQNKGLNESQKKSVIKALDEAKSLGETKALYKSLTESLTASSTKSTLSESTRFGSSSRTTASSSSATKSSTVGESDRWAKLAGLK